MKRHSDLCLDGPRVSLAPHYRSQERTLEETDLVAKFGFERLKIMVQIRS